MQQLDMSCWHYLMKGQCTGSIWITSPAPHGALPVPRRAPVPPTAAQVDVRERIPMPSPDVSSKEESVSKAEATDSAKEDKRLFSALEQKGVAGEEGALEPFKNSNPFPDAGLNRDLKRVSVGSPTESQSTTGDPTHSIPEAGRSSEDSSTHGKSVDTSRTKHSSTTDSVLKSDGEGYVGDVTWEDHTWKKICGWDFSVGLSKSHTLLHITYT
ncbi:hypothetical protein K503DRAFT_860339 [Rhizopogon vinicolor AM-OR11-026]|uniref:Uncharacterized protein n=1 Tax=Rhizopogon vinicolor AM-OR11-026 TaxID=1314800 RepID=A0A1B7MIH7_9AGAM|nr:hypothetical protein K503DRAFT_860339 [Rhizopogon vinicolor AM-OR11-026]